MYDSKVLSIAALDPSAGAGLLSDIKTFMHFRVDGFGVSTGTTYQDEDRMLGVEWLDTDSIIAQMEPLLDRYKISAIKIGMIQDLKALKLVLKYIREKIGGVQIIWDPVLASSSGFVIHETGDSEMVKEILQMVDIITPNLDECASILKWTNLKIHELPVTAVVLKGGHGEGELLEDRLFIAGSLQKTISEQRIDSSIHGSGCIYSSGMTAEMGKGNSMIEAFKIAHSYVHLLHQKTTSRLAPQHLMI